MAVALLPARRTVQRLTDQPGRLLPFERPKPQEKRFFLPQLDALRLLAFLMVWACHSLPSAAECLRHGAPQWLASGVELARQTGNLGVPIFFLLSAYLITELLRREQQATGTVALRNFYVRRVLRIWPLYFGVLAAYGLLGMRFHGFWIEPARIAASLLMVGNWYIFCHPAILTPMRALWSLSVEEQFYAAWPLLARRCSPRLFAGVCVCLFALGQAALVLLARNGQASMLHITAWVNSFVQFQFFAAGGLCALLLRGRTLPKCTPRQIVSLGGAGLAAMVAASGIFGIKQPFVHHAPSSLCAGYACAAMGCVLLLLAALATPAHAVPRAVQKLGQVSFGLYVFHETGFFFADTLTRHMGLRGGSGLVSWAAALAANKALALALTVAMALCSYAWWEKPFLRLKERFTTVRSREA